MKMIRVGFTDFWPHFDPKQNRIRDILASHYDVVVSDKPDFLFYADHGWAHLRHDCVTVCYTGENTTPDFNVCDYAIGPHSLHFGDRYLKAPYAGLRSEYPPPVKDAPPLASLAGRKFCNCVYSKGVGADPFRLEFFHRLSEYKRVDSGGRLENNVGGPVTDKLAFLSQYKFTLAFENSVVDGYTTEKILHPMQADSIPIYWGNPNVGIDFNERAYIHVRNQSPEAVEAAIEEVIALDKDDEAYRRKLAEPWIRPDQFTDYARRLSEFLLHIVEQGPERARRRPRYGRVPTYRNGLLHLLQCADARDGRPDHRPRIHFTARIRKAVRLLLRGY